MSSRTPKLTLTTCSSPKRTPPSKSFHSFRPQSSINSPHHSPSASPKLDILASPLNFTASISLSKEFENGVSEGSLEPNTRIVMLNSEIERLKEINKTLQADKDLHASQRYQGELQKELYLKLINSYQEIENLNKIIDDLVNKKSHPDERVQNLLMDLTYWKKKCFEIEPRVHELEAKIKILESDKEKLTFEIKARNHEVATIAQKFNAQIKALSNEHEHMRKQLEEVKKPKRTHTSERKEVPKRTEESGNKREQQRSVDLSMGLRESRLQVSNSMSNFELKGLNTTRSDSQNPADKENNKMTSPSAKKVSDFTESSFLQKSQKNLMDVKPPRDSNEDLKKENQALKTEIVKLTNTIKAGLEESELLRLRNNQLAGTLTEKMGGDDRIKYFLDEIEVLNNTIVKKNRDNTALSDENKRLQGLVGELQRLKAQNAQLSSEYDRLKVTTATIIDEIEEMKHNIRVNGKPRFQQF